MSASLRVRLFAGQALVVAVALALMTVLAARQQRGWVAEQTARTLERAARQLSADLPREGDWEALAARAGAELGHRVTLIDRAGTVLGDTEVPPARLGAVENHAGRPEVRAALAGRVGRALRHSRTLGEDLEYVAVPGPAGGPVAVVRLAEPLVVLRALDAALFRISLVAAALALLLSVPLVLWVAGRQAGRIRELVSVMRRLGSGDPRARARERPDDELGRLGRAINELAAEGQARLDALGRERDEREQILAHLGDGVVLLDGQGRVIRMNRSCAALLGAAVPAEPGTSYTDFVRSPELVDLVHAARREGRTVESDLRLWTPEQRFAHAAATPLSAAGAGAVLLVLHDLTETERLNRVRQDFVANVSHELRTPLTSLRGYAETLLDGGLDDPENRERFVRVIRDQAVRLEAIAEDLLTLAALERPDAKLSLERFDLREVAGAQAAAFRARAEQAGLSLTLEPGSAEPVSADRGLVEQLLANLLDNAVKYTERGGVRVRLGHSGARVWCEVEDTGAGIPEGDLPRIFERFYRVDKARSREKGGTGLGLSIVKHIAALHGGEVSVRSRPGEGSSFRFELPREPAGSTATAA